MVLVSILSFFLIFPLFANDEANTVRFAAWGGSKEINEWIDKTVSPILKDKYQIKLERIALDDTATAISKLLADKKTRRLNGRYDILWVNGENFKVMAENNLTAGDISKDLKNLQSYVNISKYQFDFGIQVQGREVPWGNAIFVMAVNQDKITIIPNSLNDFEKLLKENPGKFTYPKPPDFTGSAFIRMLMYHLDSTLYLRILKNDDQAFNELTQKLWAYLKGIRSYFWEKGSNYPESVAKLHQLYSNEEIYFSMGYSATFAEPFIQKKQFNEKTRTFVFNGKTIGNTHFLTIPFNAPNSIKARIVINELLSPALQLSKLNPQVWGDMSVLDLRKLSSEDQELFSKIDFGKSVLPIKILSNETIPELPAKYVPLIEKQWIKNAF